MSTATRRNYNVKVTEEEDGTFWAEVAELPGCFATGDTFEELMEAIGEAVGIYQADDPDLASVATVESRP